jgi:enoyl-CoA hydratase/carnithine racemase
VSSEILLDERRDGVALITLNRPEKRNALSIELREALAATFEDHDDVGCFVLTGAGSSFCSGMDTTQFGGDRAHKERLVEVSVRAFDAVALCPAPVVAAVNGPAVAGGFALALCCDIRIASTTASFGFPELGRYVPPSFAAASAVLAPAVARELSLTGRRIDAAEALELAAVGEVVERDVVGRALEVARGIAASPRSATRAVKGRILHAGETTWRRAMEREYEELREALLVDG